MLSNKFVFVKIFVQNFSEEVDILDISGKLLFNYGNFLSSVYIRGQSQASTRIRIPVVGFVGIVQMNSIR